MASNFKLVSFTAAVYLFSIFITAMGSGGQQCKLSSVEVRQNSIDVKPLRPGESVFEVEVRNLCGCTVANVRLSAVGFASTIAVDPNLFRLQDQSYLVNDGKGIPASLSVKFRYSWDHYFELSPAGFDTVCQ